jgi:hypothetical protein
LDEIFGAMARAAAYGNIQPTEFLDMEVDDATELARRVTVLRKEEHEHFVSVMTEITKVLVKALGARGF